MNLARRKPETGVAGRVWHDQVLPGGARLGEEKIKTPQRKLLALSSQWFFERASEAVLQL